MALAITQSCYSAIYEITCHLFIYAAPSSSSNVISAKRRSHTKKVPTMAA